jgi:hypothetical protein
VFYGCLYPETFNKKVKLFDKSRTGKEWKIVSDTIFHSGGVKILRLPKAAFFF